MTENDVKHLEDRITKAWFQIGLNTFLWFSVINGVFVGLALISLWKQNDLFQKSQEIVTIQETYYRDIKIVERNIEFYHDKNKEIFRRMENHITEVNKYYYAFLKVKTYNIISLSFDWFKEYILMRF